MAYYFIGFFVLILALLALDLGVFHRKDEVMSAKSAIAWTFFWMGLAFLFNAFIYVSYENHWLGIGKKLGLPQSGMEAAIAFFTAYLVEKSLSIDNIFAIAMVFSYFKTPAIFQHRVLFWGILGALLMRGVMISLGIVGMSYLSWLNYVFGGLLIATAIKMLVVQQDNLEPERNPLIRLIERFFPVSKQYHGHHFFVKLNKAWAVTPLFLALILIESMDLLFAIDSIPAVLAITLDPFIVFTSNVFAILGLRSLYFALASLMERFRHLKISLVFILAFVGTKMILSHHVHIDSLASLAVIIVILAIGIIASSIKTKKAS
jgi:tellurite resistance protein TerC